MNLGLRSDFVKWWCGVDIADDNTKITQLLQDLNDMIVFSLRPDVVAEIPTAPGLLASVRVAGEEIAAGLYFDRLQRLPERAWDWSMGELKVTPAKKDGVDLVQRGVARLRPLLKQDTEIGPLAQVLGATGKQGSEDER